MTNEKAIEILKAEYLGDSENMKIAKRIAISALEKQIPKKPLKSEREIRYCEVWKCPKCGFEWSGRVVHYCYICGQAIDWSDHPTEKGR